MRDHLKSFLAYLKLNRHVSPHTVRAYDSDVSQYLAFVAAESGKKMSELGPADLDMNSVRAHIVELNKAGKARSSVARKLSGLRTFIKYLRREEVIDHDPAAMAVAPRRDQTIPTHLSEPEVARLIETPDTGDPLGRRDRAILELFYASGLRLSELVAIDLEDLNLGDRMVRVMGKGGKERILPFNQSTASAIKAWMKDRAAIVTPERQKAKGKKLETLSLLTIEGRG
jgi:site-specific recombinase XerC